MPIDVTQVSSPELVEKEVSSESVEATQPQKDEQDAQVEISEGISATPPSPGEGNKPVMEVDEKGVPYENRYREAQRKLEAQQDRLAKMEEVLNNINKNVQPTEQTFTYEQLESWERQNPEEARQYSEWLSLQKKEAIERDVMDKVTSRLTQQQRSQQEMIIKQQALRTVAQQFPQAFAKDANGRLVDWDVSSPLTQRIIQYMEQGGYKNSPDGLVTAAKLAAFDLSKANVVQSQQTIQSQQATIGDLQRKTAIEGGGVSYNTDAHADAVARAAQTGNEKDAREALKSMFKRGNILA